MQIARLTLEKIVSKIAIKEFYRVQISTAFARAVHHISTAFYVGSPFGLLGSILGACYSQSFAYAGIAGEEGVESRSFSLSEEGMESRSFSLSLVDKVAALEMVQSEALYEDKSSGKQDDLLSKLKISETSELPEGSSFCSPDMIEVEGDYCPFLEQRCLKWLDPETKLRCAEFDSDSKCDTKTLHKHFCIDRYEYPNVAGVNPVVMKTWYEAKDACKAQGKRLCKDSEWTLACEGEERLPYPYGYVRDKGICNIDKRLFPVNEKALMNPVTRNATAASLWQGVPSGSMNSCVSPYGAHDMAGNVDEWVINESAYPYQSGSKGGYWGPVRARCRPMTTAHYEHFSFYQLGFRCCEDVGPASEKGVPNAGGKPRSNIKQAKLRVKEHRVGT